MLTVGDAFPEFSLAATVSREPGKEFTTITNKTYAGKWQVYFFWPKDFTFVCPTEVAAFGDADAEFQGRNTQVLGGSIDTEFVHLAWRNAHPDLANIPFPMLADIKRELTSRLGILNADGVCHRATFMVDPDGIIRWVCVHDHDVGRNVEEVLRVLDAFQTGKLVPCNWHKGQPTLTN